MTSLELHDLEWSWAESPALPALVREIAVERGVDLDNQASLRALVQEETELKYREKIRESANWEKNAKCAYALLAVTGILLVALTVCFIKATVAAS